ncbi:MAG: hypothetical protein EO766_12200 [Hydrotalea sp. AMD]|uniref:hypothetical protein n=1 Tax=Hydrotalea sp. AMD TaxID=2501297 RepID=UPI001026D9E9|nr:hypothetical protein [Hydrotalea sp. AMD]RWZ87279.1 MAG: hypothetical protein EO766_12200 [Hydrotalea sp. AMD]
MNATSYVKKVLDEFIDAKEIDLHTILCKRLPHVDMHPEDAATMIQQILSSGLDIYEVVLDGMIIPHYVFAIRLNNKFYGWYEVQISYFKEIVVKIKEEEEVMFYHHIKHQPNFISMTKIVSHYL